ERYRCNLAVEPVELIGPCRRQEVLPGREHLAQLDEGRPELLQGEPGTLLRFEMRDFTRLSPLQYLAGAFDQRGAAGLAHHVAQAMANEDGADLSQTGELADRTEPPGPHRTGTYELPFVSDCSRRASATPASTPLASNAIRTPASRIFAIPGVTP